MAELLTEKEKEVCAALARHDDGFYFFVRYMFEQQRGFKWMQADHHRVICDALMRVYRGECKRLIINIPPRYSKTELAVVNFIAWTLGRYPDSEFIHASYSSRLAGNNSFAARSLVMNKEYGRIFPDLQLRSDSKARDEWRTTDGGCVYATGSGGTITGYGAGKVRSGFAGCFPYGQLVQTESGPMQIGDIVSKCISVRVWSYNEETKTAELQPIDTFWTNPANEILEVGLDDGAVFRCTPNHKLLTVAGWVEASQLADPFNLIERKPRLFHRLFASLGRIYSKRTQFVGMLRFSVPDGIRHALGHAGPCFAGLDLSDDAATNAKAFGENGRRVSASKDRQRVSFGQFGAGPTLKHWKGSVAQGILHVLGLGAPCKVSLGIIRRIPVHVAGLIGGRSRAVESFKNKMGDVAQRHLASNGEIDALITLPVVAGLELPQRHGATDSAKVGDFVQTGCISNRTPVFVKSVGHVEETFCLEVRSNHNFILAESGVIVSNCIILDDPHKADEARSEVMRNNVIDWFQNTMESRKNGPETPIILIMQRLHQSDLSGWLLAGGNGEEWEHVCMPVINDDGTALWPEKHSREILQQMQDAAPYIFSGQYMQRPSPAEGGIFKPDKIQILEAVPSGCSYSRAWDFAATSGGGDWTVGAKLGKMPDGRVFIADIVRLRGGPDEVRSALKNTADRDGGSVKVRLPQDPGQAGKAQAQSMVSMLSGYSVKALPVTGDKETRAEPFAAQVNAGNVLMLRASWNDAMMEEMRMFPNGTHDDIVDALADAFTDQFGAGYGPDSLLEHMRIQYEAQQAAKK